MHSVSVTRTNLIPSIRSFHLSYKKRTVESNISNIIKTMKAKTKYFCIRFYFHIICQIFRSKKCYGSININDNERRCLVYLNSSNAIGIERSHWLNKGYKKPKWIRWNWQTESTLTHVQQTNYLWLTIFTSTFFASPFNARAFFERFSNQCSLKVKYSWYRIFNGSGGGGSGNRIPYYPRTVFIAA